MGSSRGTKCFSRAERRSRGVRRMEALTGATAAGEEGKGLFTGRRILIAEDNEITAEIICEILRMCGIITEVESNGALAVEEFFSAAPGTYDAILMDIQMPEMDGCPYRKAERLYEHAPAIRSLQLAPDGIVTYVYPLEGNENAFGSLFDHPERRAEAEYARDTGKMTLSGPYGLSQGGLGLVARKPIYLDNEGREHTFWGQRGRSECTGNL